MQAFRIKKEQPGLTQHTLIQYILVAVGFIVTILFGVWWFQLAHIPHNFIGWFHSVDYVLFVLVSYVVWYQIFNELFSWYVSLHIKTIRPVKPEPALRVAFLTAFVPGSEPYNILEKTLAAMVHVDYPHDTWLLDEGDDARAKEICKQYGVYHFTRRNKPQYNLPNGPYRAKTKGGNYNAWYTEESHTYDLIAQIDVDFVPKKNFLTSMLGYFRDPRVAFVGSPQVYGNTGDSWISRAAAEQAYNFYGHIQRGLCGQNMSLFIGANHIVRRSAHESIGGYSGHIVEDHLTGMHIYRHGWKSVYIPKVLAVGEGPVTWGAYFSQQMRWAYGLIDILFRESPRIFGSMDKTHVLNYFALQQYYFYGLAQGIGVVLLTLYFIFGLEATHMPLRMLLLTYIPVLIIQAIISLYMQRYNVRPSTERGLFLYGKLLNLLTWPVYLTALICVLISKRLTYVVTPKGQKSVEIPSLTLFMPHFIIGTVSLIGLIASIYYHHHAVQLLLFGFINTCVTLGIVIYIGTRHIKHIGWSRLLTQVQAAWRRSIAVLW